MNFDVMWLPALNASLNGLAALLLLIGYGLIRRRKVAVHHRVMLAAFCVSVLFLISYVTYHSLRGGTATPFEGDGWVRPIYLSILTSHTVLAPIVPVLAVVTLRRGLLKRYDRHRRIARWTLPIWLYVSVTGVIIYFMLYQWYPGTPH